MAKSEFVHLHVHSHYSMLDGATRVEELVQTAAEMGMKALALTDHGNLYGAMELYNEAKKSGIKPILGIEAYISPTHRTDRSMGNQETAAYHLILLATSTKGWKNLLKLSSRAYLEGFYYKPRIDRELLSQFNEGIVCSTACLGGEIPAAIIGGQIEKAERIAGEYLDIFGKDRFYLEIQNQGYPEQANVNPALVRIGKKLGIKLVGTNDVHFLRREDKATHEIVTCISKSAVLTDEQRNIYSPDLWLKDAEAMTSSLSHWPDAAKNTVAIAEMCDCKLDYSKQLLPAFATPKGLDADQYLDKLGWEGLNERFNGKPPDEYRKRLEWELKVIKDKGYSSYFLIINDCVQFARSRSIPAAPRGSGVATLLGYALRMADVDPLRYGLLFERFTDPQRKEHPDIDLDICQEGRAELIRYVRDKYGHVAQIVTYGTLKARAAVRDVGRVLGIPLPEVDAIAKLVPEGPKATLDDALKKQPDLKEMYDSDPRIKLLIDHSLRIEGLVRHSGVHAAGVVICDHPLDDFLPLCKQSDSDDAITQWDGPTCEKIGLMKMDFLGLRTLTIIQRARELVKARTGKDVDPELVPLDDQGVYELFRNGETDGVFQFESEGMKGVLLKMQPNRIEDLIAANAMYRPGPMQLIDIYCQRKHGKEQVPVLHPLVDTILAETYGVMVYQEQVMQVIFRLGKIPMNRALTGIKAISKKKEEVLLAEKPPFIKGARENGVSEKVASEIFDLILKFAGYGFNKAHSARYAIVAYQTAFFKKHYPREFLAATLTFESDDRDKVVQYMSEAARMGVKIAPPDINTCTDSFTVDGEQVRFGLAAVKGVGEKAVNAICEARKQAGAFKDLFHFCRSVDLRAVNRSTIEALIKCGAFDSLGSHRASMIASLDDATQGAQRATADRNRGQISLFDDSETDGASMSRMPDVTPWTRDEMLTAEKETLGFYVSSHPLEKYRRTIAGLNWPIGFTLAKASDEKIADGARVICGCLVSLVRPLVTKKGKTAGRKMAVLTLEDFSGKCEAVLFPDTFERVGDAAPADSIVCVVGSKSLRNERVNIIVDEIVPVPEAVRTMIDRIIVKLPAESDAKVVETLKKVFGANPGNCQVDVMVRPDGETGWATIQTSRRLSVKPSLELLDAIGAIVGPNHVSILPRKPAAPARPRYFNGNRKHD